MDRPKVRLIKAGGDRPRSGVIKTQKADGTVLYRMTCDRCDQIATVPFMPREGREVTCDDCRKLLRFAKPSTRLLPGKGGKHNFLTECDECGDTEKTQFLPKRDRPFLCGLCKAEEVKDEHKKALAEEAAPVQVVIDEHEGVETTEAAAAEQTAEVVTLQTASSEASAVEAPAAEAPVEAASEPEPVVAESADAVVVIDTPANVEVADEPASADVATAEEPVSAEAEVAPPEPVKMFAADCNICKRNIPLKFKPEEPFTCPDCYMVHGDKIRRYDQARPPRKKEGTRIFYNIECASCGKQETLDFVPKAGSDAICNDCFKRKKTRRR